MLLKYQLKSSSIAEVVIALAVISLCFTVASLVFIRATSAPMKFQDVKRQTEIQSQTLIQLYQNKPKLEIDCEGVKAETEVEMGTKLLNVTTFKGSDERILWQQEWLRK